MGIIGSFFTALAFILMKVALNRVSRGLVRKQMCNGYWMFGLFILLLGCISNTVSIGIGSQMLMAGTSSVTVILTCILSVLILHERLMRIDIAGIILICLGSTLFVIQAKNGTRLNSELQLLQLYTRPLSLIFITFVIASGIGIYIFNHRMKQSLLSHYETMVKIRNGSMKSQYANELGNELEEREKG